MDPLAGNFAILKIQFGQLTLISNICLPQLCGCTPVSGTADQLL